MKSIYFGLICPLLFLFASDHAHAADDKSFFFGTGATFFNMGKATSSDDASTSLLGQLYWPHFEISARLPVAGIFLMPSVSYTPFSLKSSDGITKRTLTMGVAAVLEASAEIDLKAGLGMLFYYLGGSGNTLTLPNGTTTATFYQPATTHTARSIYLDFGTGYRFGDSFRADLDAILISALSTRRSISAVITISKGIF